MQKVMGERRGTCGHAEVWGKSMDMEAFGEGNRVPEEMVKKRKCRRIRDMEKKRGMTVTGSQKKHRNEGYCSDYITHSYERQKTMKGD